MHRRALDEPESGVGADRLRQADASVGGVLATELCRHEPLGVAEQPLAGFAAALEVSRQCTAGDRGQTVEDERQVGGANRDPELFGGHRLELMGLVNHQRVVRSEDLALALAPRQKQRVVGDNNGSISGVAPRADHVAPRIRPVRAGGAEAVGDVGRNPAPELFLLARQVHLGSVAGLAGGEPREHLQLEADGGHIDVMSVDVGRGEKASPATQAQVVVASLEHRDRQRHVEQARHGREVAIRQLFLEVDGVGRHHRALAGARGPEREWREVRE